MANIHTLSELNSHNFNNKKVAQQNSSQHSIGYSKFDDTRDYIQRKKNNRFNDEEDSSEEIDDLSFRLEDPIWGSPQEPGETMGPCQIIGVLFCPCYMGRKQQWRMALSSMSIILSLIQLSIFIISLLVGGIAPLDDNPTIGPPLVTLISFGAKETIRIKYYYQVWRLCTPILLHAGFIHLFLNLYSQFRLGLFLEYKWSSRTWIIVYFISGIGGNLLSSLIHPDSIGVGASSALYGLLGAWFVEIICHWYTTGKIARVLYFLQAFFYILIGMIISFAISIIDWAGHLGGLLVGILLGLYFFSDRFQSEHLRFLLPKIAQGLIIVLFSAGILFFFYCTSVDTREHKLKYVNLEAFEMNYVQISN